MSQKRKFVHTFMEYKTCITVLPTWTRVQLRLLFLIANSFHSTDQKLVVPKLKKSVNIYYDQPKLLSAEVKNSPVILRIVLPLLAKALYEFGFFEGIL